MLQHLKRRWFFFVLIFCAPILVGQIVDYETLTWTQILIFAPLVGLVIGALELGFRKFILKQPLKDT